MTKTLTTIISFSVILLNGTLNTALAGVTVNPPKVTYEYRDPYNGHRHYRKNDSTNRGLSQLNYNKVQEENIKNQGEALSRKIIAEEYKDVLPPGYTSIALDNLTPEAKEILDRKKAELEKQKKEAESKGEKYSDPVSPAALEVIRSMSDYLDGLKSFRMSLDEIIVYSGGKGERRISQNYIVQRPDKIKIKSTGKNIDSELIFNGENLVINNFKTKKNVKLEIPGSIDNLINTFKQKKEYVVPVADLIHSDLYSAINSKITEAKFVGTVRMDNKQCKAVDCMSGNIRVRIWVTAVGNPIPVRIILDYPANSPVTRYAVKINNIRAIDNIDDATFDTDKE